MGHVVSSLDPPLLAVIILPNFSALAGPMRPFVYS
jgi:hypothetical protein